MRVWILKFTGFVLWSMFLFAPFIAQADDGFDILQPFESRAERAAGPYGFLHGIDLNLEAGDTVQRAHENEWTLRLNAGKDTVIQKSQSTSIQHDRIPLDHGGRDALRVGIHLNYDF